MSLDLGSVTSATISVRYQNNQIQFQQSGTNDWEQSPIKWDPPSGSTTALTITWSLGTDVESLNPATGSGITVSGNMWRVPVPAATKTDDFTVTTKKKDKIDPKIIITPQ
jgi:hypothetical protein